MSRIWAVARHMIAESIRTKTAVLFIVLILLILLTTPFVVTGDGLTVKSRLQNYLAYSLGSVGVLLSLLTVFLACGTLSTEISEKYVFMVVSKPIARWQLFLGKWLGVATLNAAMLLVTFGAAMASTWYISRLPTTVPGDAEALRKEVLSVRHNFKLQHPDWNRIAQNRIRQLREGGRIEKLTAEEEQKLTAQIIEEAKGGWRTLPPRQWHGFEFRDLMVDRRRQADVQKQEYVFLHIKPRDAGGSEEASLDALIICGDPNEPDTLTREVTGSWVVGRYHEIPIPTYAVNSRSTLYVRILNLSEKSSIMFEGDDSFELLYSLGTFHWNTFRALAIVWCRLAFLAALGLMMSSFLSFPVACMASFLVLGVSSMKNWLADSFEWTTSYAFRQDPFWVFGPILRFLGQVFVTLVPDFTKFDAVSNVVGGRLVTLKWVLHSMTLLVLVQAAVLVIIGCVVLTRRELARETA